MANVAYENAIAYLYDRLPDLQSHFKQRSKELYGEGLPHVVYGSVLVEYLESLADKIERQNDLFSDERLKDVFKHIEELSKSDDVKTIYLVKTGFMEGLSSGKKGLNPFAAYMGPETMKLAPS